MMQILHAASQGCKPIFSRGRRICGHVQASRRELIGRLVVLVLQLENATLVLLFMQVAHEDGSQACDYTLLLDANLPVS